MEQIDPLETEANEGDLAGWREIVTHPDEPDHEAFVELMSEILGHDVRAPIALKRVPARGQE